MNIVLASDNNFVQHCCVAMTSILKNNSDVHFYLLTEGLSTQNETLLKVQVERFGGTLNICNVPSDIVQKFPLPPEGSAHITIATYYRLLVCLLLPESVDKIMYLDCDIVVRGSLIDLWNIDMSGKGIGAIYQCQESAYRDNSFKRLKYEPQDGYFNAGVLLINLDFWRKNQLTDKLLEFIKCNYNSILAHDQDVLNAIFHGNVIPLSKKWNYHSNFIGNHKNTFPSFVNYTDDVEPVIVHFVSKPKCWDYGCKHPYKDEYFKYLNDTPFVGWKPKLTKDSFIKYILVPSIISLDVLNLRYFFIHRKK